MPVVAFTDFSFPSLEIKKWVVHAARAEIRASNDRHIPSVLLVADAADVTKRFEPIHADAISEMWRAKVIIKGGSA